MAGGVAEGGVGGRAGLGHGAARPGKDDEGGGELELGGGGGESHRGRLGPSPSERKRN